MDGPSDPDPKVHARVRGRVRVAAMILGLAILAPVAVDAQSTPETPQPAEAPPQEPAASDPADDWGFRWDDRPTLQLGPSTRIHFRGRVQFDLRDSEADVGDADGFDVSRRRIGIEGEIGRWVEFEIEREIDSDTPWRDVFVNYRQFAAVQVQAGKFKLPFSLDENTSSTNLDFVYRSRAATQLAPGRDRGVMVHGRVLNRLVGYEVGMFDHDGGNARTSDDTLVSGQRTLAARMLVQPMRRKRGALRDLQAGVAVTASDVPEGVAALRGRTALDASFFPDGFWVQGARRRLGLELRWRPGPYSLKAEYMRATTQRKGQSVEDGDLSDLVASGWYVSGTYLLTGEKKADGADAPRRPVFRGGYGAVEVAARVETLSFGSRGTGDLASVSPRADAILGNADRVATFGVNWYPFRGIKVQANAVAESISDPSRGPMPEKPRFWSGLLRFQLSI